MHNLTSDSPHRYYEDDERYSIKSSIYGKRSTKCLPNEDIDRGMYYMETPGVLKVFDDRDYLKSNLSHNTSEKEEIASIREIKCRGGDSEKLHKSTMTSLDQIKLARKYNMRTKSNLSTNSSSISSSRSDESNTLKIVKDDILGTRKNTFRHSTTRNQKPIILRTSKLNYDNIQLKPKLCGYLVNCSRDESVYEDIHFEPQSVRIVDNLCMHREEIKAHSCRRKNNR
ncbi:hypothetical protein GJ496_009618 [Pomphorhynchus laevis]|nr:hypothetical protein GJ496_009618 [Pomphorhynchus laevis]